MDDATAVSMWNTLVPVMVGGIIGLIGGWLGPWLVERRKEITEKSRRRAQKFEEFVAALYEHKHWLDTMERIWVFGSEEKRTMTPFARVHAISRVYFPQFESQISTLDRAAMDYEMWMFKAAEKRALAQGVPSIDGLDEAYGPYLENFRLLLNNLGEFAKQEFQ